MNEANLQKSIVIAMAIWNHVFFFISLITKFFGLEEKANRTIHEKCTEVEIQKNPAMIRKKKEQKDNVDYRICHRKGEEKS